MLDEREAVDVILYEAEINGMFAAGKWSSSLVLVTLLILRLEKVRIVRAILWK